MTDNNPYEPEQPAEEQKLSSNVTILSNIFTSPSQGMIQVQERYSIAFPMLLIALLTGLATYTYYTMVDYEWLIDYLVQSTAGDLSKAEQDQTRAGISMMSQTVLGVVSAVSVIIFIPIIYVLQAVYFMIVSNINNDGYEFKQWLSFISWTGVPALLVAIAMFALLFSSSNAQIAPESINPLSLNELFFGLDSSKGVGKLLASIHIAQFWSWAIMILGYQIWTKKSTASSAIIVLTPFVLFYLIWYLFI